ncbi:MAG: class I SAM-dependent methyltransferase [Crocinitomicaceae bacterium]|nr:class I SAM-dependent methyltransferase [Crocinitomicaceae bacterium]
MGQAIIDFSTTGIDGEIIVKSDICDDDVIPIGYLFRAFKEMPTIEQKAIEICQGRVIDIGAGAGIHAEELQYRGHEVVCIDTSPKSTEHLLKNGFNAINENFFDTTQKDFDTVLMMMNGIGIAGNLDNLERTLLKAKAMLTPNGKIICDSSDVKFLYQDDDGSMWVDLNTTYYGNFKFQMEYKEHISEWFDWLYVDFDTLKSRAKKVGLIASKIHEEDHQYLAELKPI